MLIYPSKLCFFVVHKYIVTSYVTINLCSVHEQGHICLIAKMKLDDARAYAILIIVRIHFYC